MKILLINCASLAAFILLLLVHTSVTAQTAITYPIAELGDCRDGKECYLYCQIPDNQPTCWSYAKFKLGGNVLGETTETITFPIADLGNCANITECKSFCENPVNHTLCMNFATKKGMSKEDPNAHQLEEQKKQVILEKAKAELGCTSYETCKLFCEQNRDVCTTFSQRYNLSNKTQTQVTPIQSGPTTTNTSGCKTEAACKAFCLANPGKCPGFPTKLTVSPTPTQSVQTPKKSQETNRGIPLEPPQPTGSSGNFLPL